MAQYYNSTNKKGELHELLEETEDLREVLRLCRFGDTLALVSLSLTLLLPDDLLLLFLL